MRCDNVCRSLSYPQEPLSYSLADRVSARGGAAVDAYKIIRKRSIYKTMHHEKACNAQGRNFMPWVHTQLWATRAHSAGITVPNQDIQAPRRHRKGKPPTHLPQLRHRARSTKHLPGRRAAQLYGARRYDARKNFTGRR